MGPDPVFLDPDPNPINLSPDPETKQTLTRLWRKDFFLPRSRSGGSCFNHGTYIDGNSEHVMHILRKIGLFGGKRLDLLLLLA